MAGISSWHGVRQAFPAFPHDPPYGVQTAFMRELYATLAAGGVGLFESPTGTGKTLSLICAALQWLEDRQNEDALADLLSGEDEDGVEGDASGDPAAGASQEEPDWLRDWSAPSSSAAAPAELLAAAGAKRPAKPSTGGPKRGYGAETGKDAELEFLLEEWHDSGDGANPTARAAESSSDSEGAPSPHPGDTASPAAPPKRQVIFCSRTHSQLTQFVGELRKTSFARSLSTVALASRKTLCVNDEVRSLKSAAHINERCLDMQGSNKPAKKPGAQGSAAGRKRKRQKLARCPFLSAKPAQQQRMHSTILEAPLEVEELVKLGSKWSICPYYATRSTQARADVVLMPYSTLLSEDVRESFGISLKGSVVVVDEAHNLVDAINSVHSAAVTQGQLSQARFQLGAYQERFRARLGPGNLCHIDTLLMVATRLLEATRPHAPRGKLGDAAQVLGVNDFLFQSGLDNINMFQLLQYVRDNKVAFKISGYAQSVSEAPAGTVDLAGDRAGAGDPGGGGEAARSAPLQALAAFLVGLTNTDADGRIVVQRAGGDKGERESTLKFVLLHAAQKFAQITSDAHAVVLASGTLAPVDSLVQQLFPTTPPERIHRFCCGHVIDARQIVALPIGAGRDGTPLDFRHAARSRPAMMDQIGGLLMELSAVVPGGMVVFFPSFGYLAEVHSHFEKTGLLKGLQSRKDLFFEPRNATAVESTLEKFSAACVRSEAEGAAGGGLLFSVCGGKMSEGINFGDALGRCVVMIGLPYPNAADPELKERMAKLDEIARRPGSNRAVDGRQYYEDLCMKAVNQCVGRVIRHAKDYAAIVLADQRYAMGAKGGALTGPLAKLPLWIQGSVARDAPSLPCAAKRLRHFFTQARK